MDQEELEQLLFLDREYSDELDYPRSKWIEIIQNTLDRFETYLGVPVEHEEFQSSSIGSGFCVDIASPVSACGKFNITWKGGYGAGWITDSETKTSFLYISATLFLYSNTKKLVTNSNESFLEFEYVKGEDGTFLWRPFLKNAWMIDEHGEYEYFDDPDERFEVEAD